MQKPDTSFAEIGEAEAKIEGIDIEIKDHEEKVSEDECNYCGQLFGPEEIAIEKTINGVKRRFCSEECLRDYQEHTNFKDEDLDTADIVHHSEDEDDV
jgi:hypothetical protein